MENKIEKSLDNFLNNLETNKEVQVEKNNTIKAKDGLVERIDTKTFLIEDGRQLLND